MKIRDVLGLDIGEDGAKLLLRLDPTYPRFVKAIEAEKHRQLGESEDSVERIRHKHRVALAAHERAQLRGG